MLVELKNVHQEMIVWITQTTRAGDTNTRKGIAELLSPDYRELPIPTVFQTPDEIMTSLIALGLIKDKTSDWPDVVIGPCFHIPYMQEIKRLSKGRTIVVALRPPVRGLPIKARPEDIQDTDIIVSYPYHDNTDLPNLLICHTLANGVTSAKLRHATELWRTQLSNFDDKRYLIGVLVGGDIGDSRKLFPAELAAELAKTCNRLANEMHSALLISFSARTSDVCKTHFRSHIKAPHLIYDPDDKSQKNPYHAILGSCDFIVVTADSVSMCCESVSSGKSVYIFQDERIVERTHAEMVKYLVAGGYARLLADQVSLEENAQQAEGLNSATLIVDKVRQIRLAKGLK